MNRLKELRGKRSQTVVAEALGMVQTTYSNYETGRREMDYQTLCKLAEYYGVSVDYIIGRDCSQITSFGISNEAYKTAMAYDALPEAQKNLVTGYITAIAESTSKEVKNKVLSVLQK